MSTTRKIRKRALQLLAAATVSIGVMLPAAALAQTDPYPTVPTNPPVTTVPSPGGTSTSIDTGGGGGGSLPVTGGQIAGLTLIGLGVTGAGVVMVRLGRRRPVRVET
jgi:hypothetical protein